MSIETRIAFRVRRIKRMKADMVIYERAGDIALAASCRKIIAEDESDLVQLRYLAKPQDAEDSPR